MTYTGTTITAFHDEDPERKLNERLQAVQVLETRHLWVPEHAITFTPQVMPGFYGDGRALFGIGTINSRPAYWIVRGCSSWSTYHDHVREEDEAKREVIERALDAATEFSEVIDEVSFALEDAFGTPNGGDEYDWDYDRRRYRDKATGRFIPDAYIEYPVVNYGGGAHWFRLDWPDLPGVDLVPHPFDKRVRLLAA